MLQLSAELDCEFRFVAEGAANFIFEVLVHPNESNSFLQGKLLRVAKAGTNAHSHDELQEYWESVVKPLFKQEDLVQQQLVKLGDGDVVSRLNAVLARELSTRRVDFRGSKVAEAEYGMLVEDMRQRNPSDLTLEFKPKWLAQSPSAPASATRCRNCARELLKHHAKLSKRTTTTPTTTTTTTTTNSIPPQKQPADQAAQKEPTRILCPLNFLTCATSPHALTTLLTHLLPRCNPPLSLAEPAPPLPPPSGATPTTTTEEERTTQQARLIHWLQTNTLFERLRAAQVSHDSVGPLGNYSDSKDNDASTLPLAMTLRDCTCFVRIPADAGRPVEAKLSDLDRKNGAAKRAYWRDMERRLVEGGFYEGREVEGVVTDCLLGREMDR